MRFLLFFICAVFISLKPSAQHIVKFNCEDEKACLCEKSDGFSIESALRAIDTIRNKVYLTCYHHQIGVAYHIKGNYFKAIEHHEKNLKLRKQYDKDFVWKSYYGLGIAYRKLDYRDKSIAHISEGITLQGVKRSKDSINMLRSLAQDYAKIGDTEKAIEYAQKAIQVNAEKDKLAAAYNVFSSILANTKTPNNLEQAIRYANKSIQLYSDEKKIAQVYNNKAMALGWNGQHQEAIHVYEQALEIHYKENDILNSAKTLNNIGTELYVPKKHKAAIDTLNKSLQLKQQYYNSAQYQYTYAANHENLAENHEGLGQLDTALKHYQLALINLTDSSWTEEDIHQNPKVKNGHYIYNKPDLLRVLNLKAQAAKKSGKINLAYQTYQDIDDWINEFYKDLSTNESKLQWIAEAHKTYGNAITVALEKGDKEKAFQYAEKAHAVLLSQNLLQQAAQNYITDKNDIEKRENLLLEILQADQQYRNGEVDINKLQELERQQEQLEQGFELKYPEYKKRKYQTQDVAIQDIQDKIVDKKTALLEYYLTDDSLYIFTITKKDLQVITKLNDDLAANIKNLVKTISEKGSLQDEYNGLAYKLYQQLIPENIRSNTKIDRLVIIPDKEIGTLPFAALATKQTDENFNADYPFLIKDYTTNYLYSCNSFLELQQDTKRFSTAKEFMGIAPVEYNFGKWTPLKEAGQQVKQLANIYKNNAETLEGKQATKKAAITAFQTGYQTVHLGTHAVFDGRDGQIIFSDAALTQDEIDNMPVDVYRLIFSACETAVGEVNSGEGILSLGWSFAYKGVPSITMTQWEVYEASTTKITTAYHKALQNAMTADKALRKAQLNYIDDAVYCNPYYWAALVHTGNVASLESSCCCWLWAIAILLLLLSIYFWRKQKRKE